MPSWHNRTTCSWSRSCFSSPWVAFSAFSSSVLSNAVATPKLTLTLYVGGAGSSPVLSFWLAPCGKINLKEIPAYILTCPSCSIFIFFNSHRQCQVCRYLLLSAGVGPGWSWLLGKSVRQLVAKQEASFWPCLCTLFRLFHGPADGLRRCFLHPPEYAGQCRPTRLCHVICFPGQLGSMQRFSFFFSNFDWTSFLFLYIAVVSRVDWARSSVANPWKSFMVLRWLWDTPTALLAGCTATQPITLSNTLTSADLLINSKWRAMSPKISTTGGLSRDQTGSTRISICFMAKRVFEWWCLISFLVVRTDLAVAAPLDRISHGEEVQLVHGITGRNLNSHNVAAPASPTKQVRPWIFNWYPKMVRWSFSNDLRRTTLTSGM